MLGQPRAVLLAATEDSWETTIVPRLTAAGADLDLVYRVEVKEDETNSLLVLPKDNEALHDLAVETNAALLVLDPLLSRLDAGLDTHNDQHVRQALEPLVAMAHEISLSIIGLIHVNKGNATTDVLDKIMASKAFTAVPRTVCAVIMDAEDETKERRLFGVAKNNLSSRNGSTEAFMIEGRSFPADDGDGTVDTSVVRWLGNDSRSIQDAADQAAEHDRDSTSSVKECADFLRDLMDDNGGRLDRGDCMAAAKADGFSESTTKRARTRAGLRWIRTKEEQPSTVWFNPESWRETPTGLVAIMPDDGGPLPRADRPHVPQLWSN